LHAVCIDPIRGDHMTTNDGTVGRYLGWFLVALSLGAGIIHFAFAGAHFDEAFLEGLFFAVVGWAQVTWAAAIIVRPERRLLALGAVGNTLVLAVWFVSRVWGVPTSTQPWTPEPVALADGLASGFEAAIVLLSFGILVKPALAQQRIRPTLGFGGVGASAVAIGVFSTMALSPSFASGHSHGTGDTDGGSAEAAGHAHPDDASAEHVEGHTDVAIAADGTSPCEQAGVANEGNSGHGHRGPAPYEELTAAEREEFLVQVEQANAAVASYPTVADAEAAGWEAITPYVPCIAAHFLKQDNFVDGFDPVEPEILLYDGTDPDSRIVGLSYLQFAGEDEPPEGFAGPNDPWHVHRQLCLGSGSGVLGDESTTEEDCEERGGRVVPLSNLWMMHMWNAPGFDSRWGLFSSEHPSLGGRIGDMHAPPGSEGGDDRGETAARD
jgi:hypothetical protein